MDRYVNLSDTSPMDSAHDGSLNNPWNLNDLMYGADSGDTDVVLYLKGHADVSSIPTKVTDVLTYKAWGENYWSLSYPDNTAINFFATDSSVENLMLESDIISFSVDHNPTYKGLLWLNDGDVTLSITNPSTSPFSFIACTFNVGKITITGAQSSNDPIFSMYKCYFHDRVTIKSMTGSGGASGLSNTFFCNGDHNFSGGNITITGNVYHGGNVDYGDDTVGTVINGTMVYAPSTEIHMRKTFTVNGKLYNAGSIKIHNNEATLTVGDDLGVVRGGDIEAIYSSNPNMSVGGNAYIAGRLTWQDNRWVTGNKIDLNNNQLTYEDNSPDAITNVASYYSPKLVNYTIASESNLDVKTSMNLDAVNFATPVFKSAQLAPFTLLFSVIKTEVGVTSNEITAEIANAMYAKAETDGLLFGANQSFAGYAVVELDENTIMRKGSGVFNKHIVFLNTQVLDTTTESGSGYYNTTSTSTTVIYNTGNLRLGGNDGYMSDKFYAYIFNDNDMTLGLPNNHPINNIYGAIHDISPNVTNWYSQSGSSIYFDNNVISTISSAGLVENVGLPGIAQNTKIDFQENRTYNDEELFTDIGITLTNVDVDTWSTIPALPLPALLSDYYISNRVNFNSYNINDNLKSTSDYTDTLGLFGSTREPKAVGSWYYNTQRPSSDFYVDLNKTSIGDGTTSNPANFDQMEEYFGGTGSYTLVDGDNVFIRGRRQISTTINVSAGSLKNISIEAWDISLYGPYMFEIVNNTMEIALFNFSSNNYDNIFTIKDFVVIPTAFSLEFNVLDLASSNSVYNLNNFSLLSDYDTSIVKHENSSNSVFVRCMTLSSDNHKVSKSSGIVEVYDSIIKTATPIVSDNTNDSLINSECSDAGPNSITETNVTLGNHTIQNALPVGVSLNNFNVQSFEFLRYHIMNPGSGTTFWVDNEINYGIAGKERYGIGYMYFQEDRDLTYYVDLEKDNPGIGSEGDMLTLNQFREFFNDTSFIPITTSYTFYIKGRVSNIDSDNLVVVDKYVDSTMEIEILPYIINSNGAWGMSFDGAIDAINVFKAGTQDQSNLTISITAMVTGTSGTKTDVRLTDGAAIIKFKSSLISSTSDTMYLGASSEYYGCSIVSESVVESEGATMIDTAIKAREVR